MYQSEDQQIECKWDAFESNLNKLIEQFGKQQLEIQKALLISKDAVIFTGETGSGNSTLVNWLNGAKFDVLKSNRGDCILEMSEGQETKFSKTGSGIKSITLNPEYYFNQQENILTIDFPGFRDTRGWQEQLIIQMMYMDIVNRFDTKFVVVIERPQMYCRRSSYLQELVKAVFQPKEKVEINSISLILNQFIEGKDEINELKDVINYEFEDLQSETTAEHEKQIYKAFQQNIQVVQKIKCEYDYHDIFSYENRSNLWQSIKKTQPIKIQMKQIEHSEKIGQYLQIYSDHYIQAIQNELKTSLSLENLEKKQTEELQKISQFLEQQIKKLQDEKTLKSFHQTIDFYKEFGKISQKSKNEIQQIESSFQPFFGIFKFFQQYQKFIKCYPDVGQKVQILVEYFSGHLQKIRILINSQIKIQRLEKDNQEYAIQSHKLCKEIEKLESIIYQRKY